MKLKKYLYILFVILSLFLIIPNVEAKTLRDLKNELAALKQKKANNDKNVKSRLFLINFINK